MKKPIYLDYAAATPLDSAVLQAMKPYLDNLFYNPSATYLAAKNVSQNLEAARAKVAAQLGARSSDIIFTAGGTEANNLAIHGVMKQYPSGNCIVSAIEHEAVLAPAKQYKCKLAPVDKQGRIDLSALETLIDDNTVLVSIMYANNEIGTIEPLKDVAALIANKRAQRPTNGLPLYFHTDACQAANYLDLHVSRLGVDLMTLNGGKIYGPKQSGALFVKTGIKLDAVIQGGGQERGLRSGTENVAAIIGFAEALELAQTKRHQETQRLITLRDRMIHQLSQKIPNVIVNGSLKHRLPNNVHITIPGHDNERLMMELDERGIQCGVGSACSASSEEPSHVLKAIGLSDAAAQNSLRFSLGQNTTAANIETAVAELADSLS